ncbi:Carbon-nitrogen hydrolase [Methanosarcina sp. MTP4]|uniref:nitrilase-related carbon-nitrogen hydrolase n=1 Tax=Methanosarcina sp. MTP4 TaxID=1434100 RepID=UPI000615B008|nr:nitrilase-related carbon-nitrogen hydrolase [Methanosarcina sp. MTP4]AKB25690.1 Carbon-nitrogen hydrolase [Methanosarcina sp. MTP4]
MKVACVQMDVQQCMKQKNLNKALSMAVEAAENGAELIVLPEVFSTGFCYEKFDRVAESFPGPTLDDLSCFSETHDCILVGSVIEKVSAERFTAEKTASEKSSPEIGLKGGNVDENSALFYNMGFCIESGKLVGTYRKTHPFKSENIYFSKGDSIEPIFLKKHNLKIGFEICYELRFPEVARKLTLAGSGLLITTAAFPNPRSEHWKTLVKARAIENQLPHIACNRTGKAPDASYFGGSMIIDAWGDVKADAGHKECIIISELDLKHKEEVREAIPAFEDRRPELY